MKFQKYSLTYWSLLSDYKRKLRGLVQGFRPLPHLHGTTKAKTVKTGKNCIFFVPRNDKSFSVTPTPPSSTLLTITPQVLSVCNFKKQHFISSFWRPSTPRFNWSTTIEKLDPTWKNFCIRAPRLDHAINLLRPRAWLIRHWQHHLNFIPRAAHYVSSQNNANNMPLIDVLPILFRF